MNITIENSIRDLLPGCAIEYLKEIVYKDDTIRKILLVPIKLSGDFIQEIILENKNGISMRRVFGFSPVKANLNIAHDGQETAIQLAAQNTLWVV